MKSIIRAIALSCGFLVAATAIDGLFHANIVVQEAAAIIGRPLTPLSYAGAARRTTRRMIYATSTYVPALPVGYTTTIVEGTTLYYYNGVYYKPSGNQYVVVTVQ